MVVMRNETKIREGRKMESRIISDSHFDELRLMASGAAVGNREWRLLDQFKSMNNARYALCQAIKDGYYDAEIAILGSLKQVWIAKRSQHHFDGLTPASK